MIDPNTPGPIFVAETFDNDGEPETVIRGHEGRAAVAVALNFGTNNPAMREANARRLVACWNAFLGVNTASVERVAEMSIRSARAVKES